VVSCLGFCGAVRVLLMTGLVMRAGETPAATILGATGWCGGSQHDGVSVVGAWDARRGGGVPHFGPSGPSLGTPFHYGQQSWPGGFADLMDS